MEAVPDTKGDSGLAITEVSIIGANYIRCKRQTTVSNSGDEFSEKLIFLWSLTGRIRWLAEPVLEEML